MAKIDQTLSALEKLQMSLESDTIDFGMKAKISLSMLEVALNSLAKLKLASKVDVEAKAKTAEGKRLVWSYKLGTKLVDGENVWCIKQSKLEEDE